MAHFALLSKLPSAKKTSQLTIRHVFHLHGIPVDIVSDRGLQFTASFWKEFCWQLGATVSLSSEFHPQSNGQTECLNQDLETKLRCLASQSLSSWSEQLVWVEYAYNTRLRPLTYLRSEVHTDTNLHCFLRKRRKLHAPWHWLLSAGVSGPGQRLVPIFCAPETSRLPPSIDAAPKVQCKELVRRSGSDIPLRVESPRLAPKFIGPFKILKKSSNWCR